MRAALLWATAASIILASWVAYAQDAPPCGPHDDLLAYLAKEYQEAPSAVGLASSGGLIEVFTSDDGATWTIVISGPDGNSCLLAAGKDWKPVDPADKPAFDPNAGDPI